MDYNEWINARYRLLASDEKYIVVTGDRIAGKTSLMIEALLNEKPGSNIVLACMNLSTAHMIYERIQAINEGFKLRSGGFTVNNISVHIATVPNHLRGLTADTIYIDELDYVKKELVDAILASDVKIRAFGTPVKDNSRLEELATKWYHIKLPGGRQDEAYRQRNSDSGGTGGPCKVD